MDYQSLDPFYSLVFQTVLALSGILFGVFGFLYSIFATYIILETPPKAVKVIKRLCKFTACLVTTSVLISLYALYLLMPFDLFAEKWNQSKTILCLGIVFIGCFTATIAVYISFISMRTKSPTPKYDNPIDDPSINQIHKKTDNIE